MESGFSVGRTIRGKKKFRQDDLMTIQCSIEPLVMTKDEYHYLDHDVMGIIFSVQNELGRLFDEKIYQKAIMSRCLEAGMKVEEEVDINKGTLLGTQKVNFLNPEVAVHLSAVNSIRSYTDHLQRFLENTQLKAIQWINFKGHQLTMKTIQS